MPIVAAITRTTATAVQYATSITEEGKTGGAKSLSTGIA